MISRPDRPRGRGRRSGSPPVADGARELGVPLYQPPSVNSEEALAEIDRAAPESAIVCAFGALIKEPLLSRHPMLNVHPSLLPRWRGAAPIERALIAGDRETGVCVMRLTAGLDSGPVCLRASAPIGEHDDYGTLAARLCTLGAELLVQALDAAGAGAPLPFVDQDETGATYAEKILAEDRLLDPARSAAELARIVRALHPHIGANLKLTDGSVLGVQQAQALTREDSPDDLQPGALAKDDGRLLLGTSDGALHLLDVKPPGGRAMDAQAYLRGHAL